MKKWPFFLLILLILPIVNAITCTQETVVPCTVVTPVLSCPTYNYSVYNNEGGVLQSGLLTHINDSIYAFDLINVTVNSVYTVKLCSNHTTQITSVLYETQDTGKGAILFGLILSQIGIMGFILYFSSILGKETTTDSNGNKIPKFVILRIFLILITFIWVYKIYHLMSALITGYIGLSEMVLILGITPFGWIFYTFLAVYIFINFFMLIDIMKQRKQARLYY